MTDEIHRKDVPDSMEAALSQLIEESATERPFLKFDGDVRRAAAELEMVVITRMEALQTANSDQAAEVRALLKENTELRAELSKYEGIEEELQSLRTAVGEHMVQTSRYVEMEKRAAGLDEALSQIDEITAELDETTRVNEALDAENKTLIDELEGRNCQKTEVARRVSLLLGDSADYIGKVYDDMVRQGADMIREEQDLLKRMVGEIQIPQEVQRQVSSVIAAMYSHFEQQSAMHGDVAKLISIINSRQSYLAREQIINAMKSGIEEIQLLMELPLRQCELVCMALGQAFVDDLPEEMNGRQKDGKIVICAYDSETKLHQLEMYARARNAPDVTTLLENEFSQSSGANKKLPGMLGREYMHRDVKGVRDQKMGDLWYLGVDPRQGRKGLQSGAMALNAKVQQLNIIYSALKRYRPFDEMLPK